MELTVIQLSLIFLVILIVLWFLTKDKIKAKDGRDLILFGISMLISSLILFLYSKEIFSESIYLSIITFMLGNIACFMGVLKK